MFKHFFDFSYERNWGQAVVWYLVYVLIIGGVSAGLGALFASNFTTGFHAGAIEGFLTVVVLAFILFAQKTKSLANISLALVAIVLAVFLGTVGGLIPLAILTTKQKPASQDAPGTSI